MFEHEHEQSHENAHEQNYDNEMTLEFSAVSKNEAFARVAVASFTTPLNPTVADITDIKTSVSEAVTNAIIHGYENKKGMVLVSCAIKGRTVYIEVTDKGSGIEDIEKAREPLYTSKPHMERSGLGFTVMETLMDGVEVISEAGVGTTVKMQKTLI